MNGKERIIAVFKGDIPDRIPHFELDFQITEEAFGENFPDLTGYWEKPEAERKRITAAYLDLWEKIVEKYERDAVPAFLDLAETKKRFGSKRAVYAYNGDGTFWMPSGDRIIDFAVDLYEHPDDLHRRAKEKCRYSIELAKAQADAEADFICINSDYGFNDGPFISPAMFSEFVTPYLSEIVDVIHSLGLKAILHSDGDLRKILDQLVSTGIDGYQSKIILTIKAF